MVQTEIDQSGAGGWLWWKEGEGSRQRICMNDSWTWTMVWSLTVGAGGGVGQKRAKGENCDNCNIIIKFKNEN